MFYLSELETRCPNGKKTTLYYRSKLEQSAEYLNQDGLVTCLTVYADMERELLIGMLRSSPIVTKVDVILGVYVHC